MPSLGQWWNTLDSRERTLIAVGVPAAAAAALYSTVKKRGMTPTSAAAGVTDPTAPNYVLTGPPQFSTGSSDTFDLYRQITAWLEDLKNAGMTNDTGTAVTPANPPAIVNRQDPCTPGFPGYPIGCDDDRLVQRCIDTGGAENIVAEMFRRRHSVNDPRFGDLQNHRGNACGVAYVMYALNHGVRPA